MNETIALYDEEPFQFELAAPIRKILDAAICWNIDYQLHHGKAGTPSNQNLAKAVQAYVEHKQEIENG